MSRCHDDKERQRTFGTWMCLVKLFNHNFPRVNHFIDYLRIIFFEFPIAVFNGGGKRDRTADPLLARQVLSQLSYTPVFDIRLSIFDSVFFLILELRTSSYELR
jgi:hypothetical protein